MKANIQTGRQAGRQADTHTGRQAGMGHMEALGPLGAHGGVGEYRKALGRAACRRCGHM